MQMRCVLAAPWSLFWLLYYGCGAVSVQEQLPKIRRERRRGQQSDGQQQHAAALTRRAAPSAAAVEVSASGASRLLAVTAAAAEDEEEKEPALKARYPFYHTSAELRAVAVQLASSCAGGLLTLDAASNSEVSLDVVTIKRRGGKGAAAGAESDSASPPKNRVFMLFGEHPRELISPESAIGLMRHLCSGGGGAASVLDESEFMLVLNANPRSRAKVEAGDFCLRTNPSGVDLNRNWDEMWKGTPEGVREDTNPGPQPFSEPETRLLKDIVTKYKPTTFVTVHSGTRGMYMPWAYDTQSLASRNRPEMMAILKDVDESYCQCPYGAAGHEVGYSCPGTCLDWVFDQLQTPFAFAVEIYVSEVESQRLERRWEEKLQEGGAALLKSGAHLGHPHFSYLFREYASDFVHLKSSSSPGSPASAEKKKQRSLSPSAAAMDDCFRFFNPHTEALYKKTVSNWVGAYVQLAQKVAEQLRRGPAQAPQMPV
eukprot:TRINITY_DN2665_c0_g1_i1.p1 TRINITY_DN2665_c0_g1~~TRINITY_DN2665_c0_g1_i1.p1  ORF type:complete len:484 (+),score=119.19 TRINITY_DN2665_c0_g1_i1:135-1586(+)